MAGEIEFKIVNGKIIFKNTDRTEEVIGDFWEDVQDVLLGDLDLTPDLELEYLKLFDECMFDMRSKFNDKKIEILRRGTQ